MGGGARKKAKLRQDRAAQEIAETIEAEIRDQVDAQKDDKDLFVLDVGGSKRRKKKIEKEQVCKGTSKGDLEFLHRLEKGELKRFRSVELSGKERRKQQHQQSSSLLQDLWANDDDNTERGEGLKRKRRNDCTVRPTLIPCEPGQSYNPSQEDHEKILSKAVELETKRNELIEATEQRAIGGMSKETKSLLIEDDGANEDSCISSEDELAGEEVFMASVRPSRKLTRAERNKQKRKRALQNAEKEKQQRLAQKMQEENILEIAKDVEREAEKDVTRHEERQRQRKQNLEKKRNADATLPTKADAFVKVPSIPVTLREDISGSLRKLQYQGNLLLVDRARVMAGQELHPELRPQVILPKGIGNVRPTSPFRTRHITPSCRLVPFQH